MEAIILIFVVIAGVRGMLVAYVLHVLSMKSLEEFYQNAVGQQQLPYGGANMSKVLRTVPGWVSVCCYDDPVNK